MVVAERTNAVDDDMSASLQSDCSYSVDDDEDRSQHSHAPSNDNDDDDDDDETVSGNKKSKKKKNSNSTDSNVVMDTTARVKLGVFLALSAFALLVSLLVALISLQWETQAFYETFRSDAMRLLELVSLQGQENVQTMASFGTFLTSYATGASAVAANMSAGTWPFVTVPRAMLESQAAHVLHMLNTSQLYVSPFVQAGVERQAWEAYTNEQVRQAQQETIGLVVSTPLGVPPRQISKSIFKILPNSIGIKVPEQDKEEFDSPPFSPVWQIVPTNEGNLGDIKYNLASLPSVAEAVHQVYTSQQAVLTPAVPLNQMEASITAYLQLFNVSNATSTNANEPVSLLIQPVFDDLESSLVLRKRQIVAVVVAPFVWSSYLMHAFGPGTRGILAVFNNACGDTNATTSTNTSTFTYQIDENQAVFLGTGDKHHKYFDDTAVSGTVASLIQAGAGNNNDVDVNQEYCPMTITCYASAIYMNHQLTSGPIWSTATVVVIFTIVLILFLVYGGYTEDRLNRLTKRAQRTTRLVNTLFPKEIQDRMFKNDMNDDDHDMEAALLSPNVTNGDDIGAGGGGGNGGGVNPLSKIQTYLKDKQGGTNKENDMPIADLYPNCTVMFADLVGFTAWSSGREPAQVFILLEKVYKSFDDIAKRRGVFKVETIGDCYVAVCGLPIPNKNHAVVMTRFARDCRDKMVKVARDLEVTLGPGTGDLQLRIGLHTGPVTAGVLRGERSRFQLFGDTVNTTARVESTGKPSKIHVSSSTAELLIAAGKQNWLVEREELVEAKGKGKLKTYWAEPKSGAPTGSVSSGVDASSSGASEHTYSFGDEEHVAKGTGADELVKIDNRTRRLVDWNVQVLAQLIRKIVAYRASTNQASTKDNSTHKRTSVTMGGDPWFLTESTNPLKADSVFVAKKTVIDEVREVIDMPEGDATAARTKNEGELSDLVMQQLERFITIIASLYPHNPFHDFDHASNVTMSTVKMLSRIIEPCTYSADCHISSLQATLANNPLTQFACVFSALTHDVNHPGVSNMILVKENSLLARAYKNKSVAEQNSIDVAWDLLMQDTFRDLRDAICATDHEMRSFRQLVVNAVMATDIMDADLKALRNKRWERAFGKEDQGADATKEAVNRKATIVIEHLIQASDVAHTMQHWHIYRRWNEKLFREMYKAYKEGRIDQDPATNWYSGEIGFFDFYIIPLAKKLSDCGVFGVSSDEYLSYAKSNRQEWEQRGQEIVAEMVEKVNIEQQAASSRTSSSSSSSAAAKQAAKSKAAVAQSN